MWYLTSSNDDRTLYVVPPENQVSIGRSSDNEVCTFAIPNDPSISRKHAMLTITNNELLLQDLGSRYGTYLNDSAEKFDTNTHIKLNKNDIVKFGKMQSVWKVNCGNLITCTSTLKGENVQNLKVILSKIGGALKNDWDDSCQFLTMPEITLTIKVVLALVQGSYIVTMDFWEKCLQSVENHTSLPDPSLFTPQVKESTLNKDLVSFLPNAGRKQLFEGKKFVFFSRRQYEMYKLVLIKSSASPLLLSECKMSTSALCLQDVIVIQYVASAAGQETQSQKTLISDIVTALKAKGLRVVADLEIGLAILYGSTDKYCNPRFNFTSEVVKQPSAQPLKTSKLLALDSQEPNLNQQRDNVKINESLLKEDSCSETNSAKRKLGEITSEDEMNANKKIATSALIANIKTEPVKRRFSGEDPNPVKKFATDQSDDMFNFITDSTTNDSNKVKKLNLSRPQKRKMDGDRDNDDLFNFIENDEKQNDDSKQGIFSLNKSENEESTNDCRRKTEIKVDVSSLRGVKLKELMERNTTNGSHQLNVKKEKTDELLEKMTNLDLGNTIVIPCNDLIVKKEPLYDVSGNTSLKNFKTFRKVWPVRKQASSINMESNSLTFTAAY